MTVLQVYLFSCTGFDEIAYSPRRRTSSADGAGQLDVPLLAIRGVPVTRIEDGGGTTTCLTSLFGTSILR